MKYAIALKGEETEILEKEEMKEIKDLLTICLKLDHRLRPKASEILKMNLFKDVEWKNRGAEVSKRDWYHSNKEYY